MIVLDASALLAFLQGEPGADLGRDLDEGAACGAANWSEVAATVRSRGADWGLASALLLSHELGLREVTVADAQLAAEQRHLSLGDWLCLALAERLNCDVLTADRAWGDSGRVRQLRWGQGFSLPSIEDQAQAQGAEHVERRSVADTERPARVRNLDCPP